MAKIILTRKRSFLEWFSKYAVIIDGQHRGYLKNGQTEEFSVADGEHTVKCLQSWYGSNIFRFSAAGPEVKYLRVGSNRKLDWLFFSILFIALLSPVAMPDRREDLRYFGYIALGLVFAYGLYNLIFARNKALRVEEDRNNIFAH